MFASQIGLQPCLNGIERIEGEIDCEAGEGACLELVRQNGSWDREWERTRTRRDRVHKEATSTRGASDETTCCSVIPEVLVCPEGRLRPRCWCSVSVENAVEGKVLGEAKIKNDINPQSFTPAKSGNVSFDQREM